MARHKLVFKILSQVSVALLEAEINTYLSDATVDAHSLMIMGGGWWDGTNHNLCIRYREA